MMSKCASVHRKGKFSPEEMARAAAELLEVTGGTTLLAFAFVSPDYLPHAEEMSEIVRVDGHVIDLVGVTGIGLTANGEEDEPGFSLLALAGRNARFDVLTFTQSMVEESSGPGAWRGRNEVGSPCSWIMLANPNVFDAESWLSEWNAAWPGVPCVGGLAAGTDDGEDVGVFYNGRVVDALAVGISGLKVLPLVSQGCRPIGEPLTVTRADSNVVYSLGAHPAYEALESAFETLSDGEKATAKGNLFAGLAGTEYVEDFKPGDFLIRNILGADPNSGAVVIGGIPRVGQTLQYQLRDTTSADTEWRAVLRHAATECGRPPLASLLFACSGRGSHLFGSKGRDAGLLEKILGEHASAGIFCNGEIGPLGDRNYIHSHSAVGALFFEEEHGV
jgi:small ligand-binding sensory domain FIST